MRRWVALAISAMMLVCAFAAGAEETEYDPAKVSESLKAIFQFGSTETKKSLNANTVTLISGTIGGTYVQFGADLASVLDDGNKMRVLPIVGRGSVQSVADILFLQGVDLGLTRFCGALLTRTGCLLGLAVALPRRPALLRLRGIGREHDQ